MMCGGLTSQPTSETEISPMQRRTKDPKTLAQTTGNRGLGPYTTLRRRRIPSISSCPRNNFGRHWDARRPSYHPSIHPIPIGGSGETP
ncbi:hypothetical protein THAOC_23396 [Thalassiosira oceanica]|uniref:Uncharacterized protein n=1 Tax=Thalassiosira oceanica TaxID=159749 RepID=K0RW96_THAOC|nr:hypothetical protein THAOC_23396 [Thalassiosira oceanica]|eukprot:EJK56674.1 hypothetical protein THAOC_23396 [Thalassiosira oceanica]